jgi:hypothetical protein
MKGLTKLSPMQLVCLALGGSLLGGTFFLLPVSPGSPLRFAWITLGIALFVVSIILPFKVRTELESGIANQRWPEAQVQQVRSLLNSSAAVSLMVVFLIAYATLALQHGKARHVAYCFYLPILAIGQLAAAAKEPKPKGPFERLDWKSIPPLQSSHWGER